MPLLPKYFHHPLRSLCIGVAATSPRGRAAGEWDQGLPPMKKTLEERFWSKVDKSAGADDCWPWTAGVNAQGYGQFYLDGAARSHRVAWQLTNGPIPDGLHVLHHCDNTRCCNVSRCLFLGTNEENIADKMAKGRHRSPAGAANGTHTKPESVARGARVGSAKLSESEALAILAAANRGEHHYAIAVRFGVGRTTVRDIVNGRCWKHIERGLPCQ